MINMIEDVGMHFQLHRIWTGVCSQTKESGSHHKMPNYALEISGLVKSPFTMNGVIAVHSKFIKIKRKIEAVSD